MRKDSSIDSLRRDIREIKEELIEGKRTRKEIFNEIHERIDKLEDTLMYLLKRDDEEDNEEVYEEDYGGIDSTDYDEEENRKRREKEEKEMKERLEKLERAERERKKHCPKCGTRLKDGGFFTRDHCPKCEPNYGVIRGI